MTTVPNKERMGANIAHAQSPKSVRSQLGAVIMGEKNKVHDIGSPRPSPHLQECGPQPSRQADVWASKGWTHGLFLVQCGCCQVCWGYSHAQVAAFPTPAGLPIRRLGRVSQTYWQGILDQNPKYSGCEWTFAGRGYLFMSWYHAILTGDLCGPLLGVT